MPRAAILFAVVAAVLAVGLYPYDWSPPLTVHPNGAVVDDGLAFPSPGIARTAGPPPWLAQVIGGADLALALDVEAAGRRREGRILALSRDATHVNLSVGRSGDDLVVELGRPRTRLKRRFRYAVPDAFAEPGPRHIVVAAGGGRLEVRVDGEPRLERALPRVWARKWDPGYRLSLGNEPDFSRPWLGRVRKAEAVVGGTRRYDLLDGDLETPRLYVAVREPVRYELVPFTARPLGERRRDLLVNLAGFLPVGFLLAVAGRGRLASACLGCVLLSAGVEAGQFFLADRVPAATDVVCNALGGAIGALAGTLIASRSAAR